MKLSFRQGIIRYEQNQAPAFITPSAPGATTVNLNVIDQPVAITFAHGNANYIVEETRSVVNAWGAGDNANNAPMTSGPTYYLFWEINQATGSLQRGWTTIPWISGAVEPTNPQVGLHWFDTVNGKMRLWRQSGSNPPFWQDVIRVFAGTYNGSTVTPYAMGSQVGLVGNFEGGNIILGANNAPLRMVDGTFVTTTTVLTVQQTSGQNVKFEAALVFGQASEEIPAFYMVSFLPDSKIKLARSGENDECAIGIVTSTLAEGEVGQIVSY